MSFPSTDPSTMMLTEWISLLWYSGECLEIQSGIQCRVSTQKRLSRVVTSCHCGSSCCYCSTRRRNLGKNESSIFQASIPTRRKIGSLGRKRRLDSYVPGDPAREALIKTVPLVSFWTTFFRTHYRPGADLLLPIIMGYDKHGSRAKTVENIADAHGFKESEGYVVDIEGASRNNLKTARDGHTILIPQPSDSPSDTLNWTKARKHIILIIVSLAAFFPDYGSATGAVTLLPQPA
jgi:hypothetical protein